MGEDKYPATITAAYELMSKYKYSSNIDNNNTTKTDDDRTKGTRDPTNAQFAQVTQPNKRGNTPIAGTNGQCYPATECYNCRNTGHIATYCPHPRNSSHFQALQHVASLAQATDDDANSAVPNTWILLDSASTISSMCNRNLIENIRDVPENDQVRAWTNGGHLDFSQKCDLKTFRFEAYFNKNGITNILSLAEIRKKIQSHNGH